MDLDKFLHFYVHRIDLIIGALIVIGLLLTALLLFRFVFRAKETDTSADPQFMKGVESSLKSLIEEIKSKGISEAAAPAPAAPPATASADGSPPAAINPNADLEIKEKTQQLNQLQGQLGDKEKEIEKLRGEIQKLGTSSAGSDELKNKVTELEARLAEYEIIEDDIADLSHYKEENEKLKQEIEALKSGQGIPSTPAPSAPAPAAPVAEAPPAEEKAVTPSDQSDFDQQFASELEAALKEGEAAPATPEMPIPVESPAEAPTSLEQLLSQAAPEPEVVAEPEPAPVAKQPPPKEQQKEAVKESKDVVGDDIMAEFSGLDEFKPVDDEWHRAINTDKMLEEVSGLSEAAESSSLDDQTDVDRMLKEASELGGKTR